VLVFSDFCLCYYFFKGLEWPGKSAKVENKKR
jgi:hypothetical protein